MKRHLDKLLTGVNNLLRYISQKNSINYVTIGTFDNDIKYLFRDKISSNIVPVTLEDFENNFAPVSLLYAGIEEILNTHRDKKGSNNLYIVSVSEDSYSREETKKINELLKIYEHSGYWKIIHCSTSLSKLDIRYRYSFSIEYISEIFNTLCLE